MNIPMSWLTEYAPIGDYDINDFVSRLTMIGQKVETVDNVSGALEKIVVGKVLSIEKHPNAEKLYVAEVDTGAGVVKIATGAENVKKGDFVPVALDGAVLAGGKKITKTDMRGVVSEGMLCSIEELGFTRHDFPDAPEHGIYVLNGDNLTPGTDVCELLELRQEVVEYEITSNRPDCVSVLGIAREAAAAYGVPLKNPDLSVKETAGGNAADMVSIEIADETLCPRYVARIIKNVKVADSPQWLRRRLTSAGVRPINNIVDITNYVMLEMGQPMHAFDLSSVAGGIVVRRAKDGEPFTTLDGAQRKLDNSMLVIADHEKAIGIAGVMGGENSKITLTEGGREATGAVLLESANFNGTSIRLTSKKLGLRTDASSRFEKGLDPNLAELAADRAANLIELLGAGEVVRGKADCFPKSEKYTQKREIPFEPDKINALLGTEITPEEMARLIAPFEIEVTGRTAVIPTFRADMEGMADIAEEVARAYGYDIIEPQMLGGAPTVGKKTIEQNVADAVKDAFASFGFYEALTYSFESPDAFEKLLVPENDALRNAVPILNPLGEAYSLMRTTAANSLLTSLALNYGRRNPQALLFELANIYKAEKLPVTELPGQETVLAAVMYGAKEDFYTAKGYAETLFEILGIENYDFSRETPRPWLHPGRSAEISIAGAPAGFVGEVHPKCLENYEIGKRAFMLEISMDALYANASLVRRFAELPKYPAIERDIALIVSDAVPVKDIGNFLRENGGAFLSAVSLFDVYTGGQVGEGFKSVAYSLVFRSRERTLSDGEVNPVMSELIEGLKTKFGAKLRE